MHSIKFAATTLITFYLFYLLIDNISGFAGFGEWNYELQRVELLNETQENILSLCRVQRINRTVYGISGYALTNIDLTDGNYDIEVISFVSTSGSTQFILSPMKFPRMPFCEMMNKNYRRYLMGPLKEPTSNLPYSDDPNEDICVLELNKNYTVNNYYFDKSVLPEKMQHGLYKIWVLLWRGAEIIFGYELLVKVFE